jgi:hypothetical protein
MRTWEPVGTIDRLAFRHAVGSETRKLHQNARKPNDDVESANAELSR